jgi:ubiquinone/menaquinone biosynthesis C-methylase UbiE
MSRTKDYYNSISDYLVSEISQCYYNGSLIIDDIDSDPNTFVDQDVNNIIKLSKLGNNILELGCGTGYFFKRLIEKNPTIKYHGIDISDQQIKNAKLVNPGYQNLFSVVDWNDGLPFESESFDTLLFLETIGYTKNIDNLLSECYRVLKPGGSLFTKHPGCVDTKKLYYNQAKNDLMPISEEYGYEEDSLGMVMDVNKFIDNLKQYNFIVPEGYQIPTIDNSIHVKSFYIDSFRPYMEDYKSNSRTLSSSLPSRILKEFDWNNLHNDLGKTHPFLCETFKQKNITQFENEIFHPCVVITAYKK